jgi:hypothetical protein
VVLYTKLMKSILLSVILLVSIHYAGISQITSKIDSLQISDTIFYPDHDPNIRIEYEIMPEFPGGPDSLIPVAKGYLNYPQHLIKDSIQGRLIISFTVDEKGIAGDVSFLRTLHPELEQQCIEMVKHLPKFKPGYMLTKSKKGWYWRPAKFYFMLPVYFGTTNRNAYNTKLIITP